MEIELRMTTDIAANGPKGDIYVNEQIFHKQQS